MEELIRYGKSVIESRYIEYKKAMRSKKTNYENNKTFDAILLFINIYST